jgi:sarcosine oxidase subunit gamma
MTGYNARLDAISHKGMLDLRGDAEAARLCGEALACRFPAKPNTKIALPDHGALICLSDDHWILETVDGLQLQVLEQLELAAEAQFHSFCDVSDMYSHFRLSGLEAMDVLAQCVAIDIHPSVFGPGSTARCAFADAVAQVSCLDNSPAFEISVFSSYERYVTDFLSMAMGD